jgi:hypothetical protein
MARKLLHHPQVCIILQGKEKCAFHFFFVDEKTAKNKVLLQNRLLS